MKRTRYTSQTNNTRRIKQTNLTELEIYPTPHNFFFLFASRPNYSKAARAVEK